MLDASDEHAELSVSGSKVQIVNIGQEHSLGKWGAYVQLDAREQDQTFSNASGLITIRCPNSGSYYDENGVKHTVSMTIKITEVVVLASKAKANTSHTDVLIAGFKKDGTIFIGGSTITTGRTGAAVQRGRGSTAPRG